MKKSAFGIITLLFVVSIGGSLPIIYFNFIEPRLALMDAKMGIAGIEIAHADNLTITFAIKLRVLGPMDKNIIVPKLDLAAFAGFYPLGVAWTPMEFECSFASYILSLLLPSPFDYNAFLYLRMPRTENSALMHLFNAILHGSDMPLTLTGEAYIGGLPFSIPPMTFSMIPSPIDPLNMILEALNLTDDMVGDFLTYIQDRGVNLTQMVDPATIDVDALFEYLTNHGIDLGDLAANIPLDALGLIDFLDSYNLSVFDMMIWADLGVDWYDCENFTLSDTSNIKKLSNRIGLQQAIFSSRYGNPAEDIMTNPLKIAWDLDDREIFNGTPYSRVDPTYEQPINYTILSLIGTNANVSYNFSQSYDPDEFYMTMLSEPGMGALGANILLRDMMGGLMEAGIDVTSLGIEPQRVGGEYINSTTEEWDIIPGVNFSIPTQHVGKQINYIRLGFYDDIANPQFGPLDIEADGNLSSFNGDYLSIYDLNTYNAANPEQSLLLRYDQDMELSFIKRQMWYDGNNNLTHMEHPIWTNPFFLNRAITYFSPWLPTDSVKLIFSSNGTNSGDYWGFRISNIGLDFDTPMDIAVQGNYSLASGCDCINLDNDTVDADHKQYFNPTAFLIWDLWHQAYVLNQTYNYRFEEAWANLTYEGVNFLTLLTGLPSNPLSADFTSDGMSIWDLLWWLNYHYDTRYLLELSEFNEGVLVVGNLLTLMNPLKQANFFYGDVDWYINASMGKELLKNITGFPTMSPVHAFVDFMSGAPFAEMAEPLNFVKVWKYNSVSGEYDILQVVNHTEYYKIADMAGTGGPYGADTSYMKVLKYHDIGFLENMLFIALTQNSSELGSVWGSMYNITKDIMGAQFNETKWNITQWNTNPLPLKTFITAMVNASEQGGGADGAISSLLYGYDLFEMIDYITNKTGAELFDILDAAGVDIMELVTAITDATGWTMGDIFDAVGIEVYDMITFIANNIMWGFPAPYIPPLPFDPNNLSLDALLIYLTPAYIAIPAVAIYLYISKRRE